LSEIGFRHGSFDVVYAAQVFEHLPTPAVELAEIRSVLRPEGLLYIDVPNYQTLSILLGRDDFMLNEPPQHVNYFTPQSLRRLLQSAGFANIRVSTDGGLKWENLLGRSIKSEIKDAYGLDERSGTPSPSTERRVAVPVRDGMKRLALKALIQPVFYHLFKVGMRLVAVGRRP
jgi:SAM-dependent methyltransferase